MKLYKLWFLERMLDFRLFKKNIILKFTSIFLTISLIRKLYLLLIVCFSTLSLLQIIPQASGLGSNNSSRASLLINAQASTTSIVYTPIVIIPTLKDSIYRDYSVYVLKEGESLDTVLSRTGLLLETLTVNNPGFLGKEGDKILLPKADGYLFPFNASLSDEKIASLTGISLDIVRKNKSGLDEGYILIESKEVVRTKKSVEDRQVRLEYKERFGVDISGPIEIVGSSGVNGVSNSGADFSKEVTAFYNFYKGRRHADPDGAYSGECVSLAKRWQVFIGASYGVWPDYQGSPGLAFAHYMNGNKAMAPYNNKYGEGKILAVLNPKDVIAGDIITTKFNGSFSHTGIATGKIIGDSIEIVEQNTPTWIGVTQIGTTPISGFRGAIRYIK